jgi:putative ABC transport system ATP-binding protein
MGAPVSLFAYEGVVVHLGGERVLDGVDAVVPDGVLTCLVGPSGSGKSTLLRLGNRLVAPSGGVVRFRSDDVASIDPLRLRRRVGMVFQRPTPFPGTGRDNLLVAVWGATRARRGAPPVDDAVLLAALARAELPAAFLDRDVAGLSGGEAQRLCLARALVTEPEVLLLDEPTSALDHGARAALERLARTLCETGTPVVWVTHDHAQVRRLADHVVVLDAGRAVAVGTPAVVRPHLEPAGDGDRGLGGPPPDAAVA